MTNKELRNWFFDKLTNCYSVVYDKYPDNIIYYYDENFIRKCKIAKINNIEIEQPLKPNGICLFDQDLVSECLWCNYDYIWSYFKKHIDDDDKIKKIIMDWLKNDVNLNNYNVQQYSIRIKNRIKNSQSLKSYKIDILYNL